MPPDSTSHGRGLGMSRSWSRRVAALGVVPVTAVALVVSSALPAHANSGIGVAQNAWLVTDLAVQAGNVAASAAQYDPVLEAEAIAAKSATTTTTAAAGAKAKPKASGKLGLIVNTAVVLGALAFEFGGGSDEPALPSPPATGATTYVGTANCGWTTIPAAYLHGGSNGVTCSAPGSAPSAGQWTTPLAGSATLGELYLSRPLAVGTPAPQGWGQCGVQFKDLAYFSSVPQTKQYYVYADGNCGSPIAQGLFKIPAVGAPLANPSTPGTSSDPALVPRYIDSEITCKSAGGGSQVLTQRTGPFTVTPGQPNMLPDAPEMSCPAGTWLSQGKRELATEGSTEKVPLAQPYTSPPWVEQQVQNFPECFPAGNAKCVLELIRKATATAPELNCNSVAPVAGHACRDWMTDPNKANRYECRFGGTPVALRRCEPYAKAFTQTPTLTRTPENPDGAPTPAPAPGADPSPGDTPNLTGCTPEWAELLSPWWVFKAASCALAWAFIPPTGYLDAKVGTLRTQWNGTTPGLWLAKVNGLVTVPTGNCGGIPVDVDLGHGVAVDAQLGEACSGRMATTASLVKLAATAFICVGGAFAGVRILGAGLGWAPGIGKGVDA